MTLSKGSTGESVHELERLLIKAGYALKEDGLFDDATEQAVRSFQQSVGLITDGIAGEKTLTVLRQKNGTGKFLTQFQIENVAKQLDVHIASIMAINEVESAGTGFLPDGRIKILFERHVMYRQLERHGKDAAALSSQYPNLVNQQRGGYRGGQAEYIRLNSAIVIDKDSAMESCSYGSFQIMGYHWQAFGYQSVQEFVQYMSKSEDAQLAILAQFIKTNSAMLKALKAKKWADFARLYNGPAYKENLYDVKLSRAFDRYSNNQEAA